MARVPVTLWLHREERDAWLVSRGGVGAGVFLPKSEMALEDGHPQPLMGPVGPVNAEVADWLAEREGLIDSAAEGQGSLF